MFVLISRFNMVPKQDAIKLNLRNYHSHILATLVATTFGIACNLAALFSDTSISDNHNLRIASWNICDRQQTPFNTSEQPFPPAECLEPVAEKTEQPWINRAHAAQSILLFGCILHTLSLVTVCIALRFLQKNNLTSLNTTLVVSASVQAFAFFFMLHGYYLLVVVDVLVRLVLIGRLFIYFGLCMIASITINYFIAEFNTHYQECDSCLNNNNNAVTLPDL